MRHLQRILVVAALVVCSVARAEVEVTLQDDRRLTGADLQREGENYVLTMEGGGTIVLPVDLVRSVRLSGSGEPSDTLPAREPTREERPRERRQLAGEPPPEGPTAMRTRERPRTLAGTPASPPRRSEQLAALGPPARFQRDIVPNTWRPSTDWVMDPENNNFAPSTWAKAPFDSEWKPKSAWGADSDALADTRSTWSQGVVDSTWAPTDGFAK